MKTALVLSAGGMYAAWEAGVWKALQRRWQPDVVVGASAGALNGWAIAGGVAAEELASHWLDPRTGGLMHFGVHRTGVLRPEALEVETRELAERFHPRIPFGLVLAEVPRLRPRLVRDSEITWKHLLATCAIPLGYPPVRIDGHWYVDGGLVSSLPLWAAEEMGAERALALNVLTALPFRMLRAVLHPRRASAALKVIHLVPGRRLGPLRDAVRWSADNIRRWIAEGERDGERALELLIP